jgi:hypothetical protein
MAKWTIYGAVRASKYVGQVEAETEEEAIEKGWKLDTVGCSVCHQCADEIEDPEIEQLVASLSE